MKRAIAAAFTLLVIFSATTLLFAKGITTRITITSSELQRPIEIDHAEILKNFNVCRQGRVPSRMASRETTGSLSIGLLV